MLETLSSGIFIVSTGIFYHALTLASLSLSYREAKRAVPPPSQGEGTILIEAYLKILSYLFYR